MFKVCSLHRGTCGLRRRRRLKPDAILSNTKTRSFNVKLLGLCLSLMLNILLTEKGLICLPSFQSIMIGGKYHISCILMQTVNNDQSWTLQPLQPVCILAVLLLHLLLLLPPLRLSHTVFVALSLSPETFTHFASLLTS